MKETIYDAIIIGGSYAGLSAAMALGRSRRRVLIIDSGLPCNRQTPHAHNLITHDGNTPAAIAQKAREQVLAYPTISLLPAIATTAKGTNGAFEITAGDGSIIRGKKLLIATGVRDIPLPIAGFEDCWGISILHCPYCHGYEVRDEALGIIANGDMAFEFARLIHNWSKNLVLFTNGTSTLDDEKRDKLRERGIGIVEKEISAINHQNGHMQSLQFSDGSAHALKAVFARAGLEQNGSIAKDLGCEFGTEPMFNGLIKTDDFGHTTVPGVYAAGDNCSPMRSLSNAIAAGGKAGAFINHELIAEEF